ncbi:MAG: outer membrane protein assembly factor BamB [Planctomycetota bacterium]
MVTEGVPHERGHKASSHASATLRCLGNRLVAFFGSRGLYILDMDGELQWSKPLGQMKTLASFGEGSTPAVHEDAIIVQWDEEEPSFVAAFDLKIGDERWRSSCAIGSSWGCPIVAVVDERSQVILTGSDATHANDLTSGEKVWTCPGMPKDPVNSARLCNGLVYVMNSFQGAVIQAIDLSKARGDVTEKKSIV